VDTADYHNPSLYFKNKNEIPVVGWTGSHTTLQYLHHIIPLFKEVNKSVPFKFQIICDTMPDFDLDNMEWTPWKLVTEIKDLMKIDIGVMPLSEDDWSKGKCGFKLIQYLSLEIPALASPVGVNTNILHHGVHGYHCTSNNDWVKYLKRLIQNPILRRDMGKEGRKHIQINYSKKAHEATFLSLFE
jgi:glycosyltransferase involved in cell wall biosynthesis